MILAFLISFPRMKCKGQGVCVKLENHNIKTLEESLLSELPSPTSLMLHGCKLIKASLYSWTGEYIPGYCRVLVSPFSLWTWEKDWKSNKLFINYARRKNKKSAGSQRIVSSNEEMKKCLHESEVHGEIKWNKRNYLIFHDCCEGECSRTLFIWFENNWVSGSWYKKRTQD